MKKFYTICLLLCACIYYADGQVIDDNKNLYSYFYNVSYWTNDTECVPPDHPCTNGEDDMSTRLLLGSEVKYLFQKFGNPAGSHDGIWEMVDENNLNETFDSETYTFDSWEDDAGQKYSYDEGDDDPCGAASATVAHFNQNPGQAHVAGMTCSSGNGNGASMRWLWRYYKGDDIENALDFGTYGPGQENSHENRINFNGTNPISSSTADLEYTDQINDGFNFNNNPEIVYTFKTNQCLLMDLLIEDFGSATAHFVEADANGNIIDYIESFTGLVNDIYVAESTGANKYAIIIEGTGTGYGKLTVSSHEWADVTAGSIIQPNPAVSYITLDPGILQSSQNPSGDYSTIQWQRSISNNTSWQDIQGATSVNYDIPPFDLIGKHYYRRKVSNTTCNIHEYSNEINWDVYALSGSVSGKVYIDDPNTGAGVSGVTVNLTNLNTIPGYGGAGSVNLTTTTGTSGSYDFNSFPVGPANVNWKVTPSFTDPSGQIHEFAPESSTFLLYEPNNVQKQNVNFLDETSFSLSGRVTHLNIPSCGMPDIEVRKYYEGQEVLPRATTDDDGNYELSIPNAGTWTIEPIYADHDFSAPTTLDVIQNQTEINFTHNEENTLTINLNGGCGKNIGTAVFSVKDTVNQCTQVLLSNSDTQSLPAKTYSIKMDSYDPPPGADQELFNEVQLKLYFDNLNLEVDLSSSDTILNLVYHPKPTLIIDNIPEPPCDALNVGIIPIHTYSNLVLNSWDIPPGAIQNDGGCRLDTGYIYIEDNISSYTTSPIIDTIIVNGGLNTYLLKAGIPNIAKPYTKNIVFNLWNEEENNRVVTEKLIVEGNRPRTPTYASVSPDLPTFILRDPPTDNGFAELTIGKSITNDVSWGGGVNNSLGVKAGLNVDVGECTVLCIQAQTGATFDFETSTKNINTQTTTQISKTTLATSSGQFPENIGEGADLYYGRSYVIQYAINDVLNFNLPRCEVTLDQELAISPDSIHTTFVKTHTDIVGPGGIIETLRNDIIANTEPDSVARWLSQVRIWESLIEGNRETKLAVQQNSPIYIYDIGAGGSLTQSFYTDTTSSHTYEWEQNFDLGFFAEYQDAYHGFGAVLGGSYNHSWTNSETTTNSTNTSTEIKYHLHEDDTGDNQVIEIYDDPKYPSHIFISKGGDTSCPWEEGTLKRHAATLTSNVTSIYDVPADQAASFVLTLSNVSETGETMDYFLEYIGSTGFGLFRNADPNAEDVITLNFGESVDIPVSFDKLENDYYSFEGIQFVVYAGCTDGGGSIDDYRHQILAEVKLNIYFDPPCSGITIAQPEEGWLVSSTTNNQLNILLTDYDNMNMNDLEIEYAPITSSSYTYIDDIDPSTLNSNSTLGTIYQWNTTNVPDGKYKVRAKVTCPNAQVFSNTIAGEIENSLPYVIGFPYPTNRILNDQSYIGADFNEPISPLTSSENVKLVNALTMEEYHVDVVVADRKLYVYPQIDLLSLPPAAYMIDFFGVQDLFGNPMTGTESWSFSVGEFIEDDCDENTVYYVDTSIPAHLTSQDGKTWESCFVNLSQALREACPGSKIYVAEGTYYPTDDLYRWDSDILDTIPGDTIYFDWTHSYSIYGGFPSGGGEFFERNAELYPTILSGDANKDGIHNDGDCHTILHIDSNVDAVLDGFIIQDAFANGAELLDLTGAVYTVGHVDMINCIFRDNMAIGNANFGQGGAIFCTNTSFVIANCLFHDNESSHDGGAVTAGFSDIEVVNCTFSRNEAGGQGDAIASYFSTFDIYNSIYDDNGESPLVNINSSGTNTMYNTSLDIATLPPLDIIDGGNNIVGNDPLFIDPMNDNFKLQATSNAINQGVNSAIDTITTIDLSGMPRKMDSGLNPMTIVDLGAYEVSPCADVGSTSKLYVDGSIPSELSGTSWATPLKHLSSALAKAKGCGVDTILVAQGYYLPTQEVNPSRNATFEIHNGLVLIGGYPSGGGPRDIVENLTILSGNIGDANSKNDNAYHVLSLHNANDNTVIDGFTISDGNANGSNNAASGGGILHTVSGYGVVSSPIVKNCIFKYNSATNGGAIACRASNYGEARIEIMNSLFENNNADVDGGAIYDYAQIDGISSSNVKNSVFDNNKSGNRGGAMYFVSNDNGQARPILINNTIYGNRSADVGGGIYANTIGTGISEVTAYNSIIYGNSSAGVPNQLAKSPNNTHYTLMNNNVEGGYSSMLFDEYNMDTIPYFVGAHVGNFGLDACSPLIDKGDDLKNSDTLDYSGNIRNVGIIDIGAIEYDGFSSRGNLPETLDDIVLNCLKPLHFGVPSDGITYALYDDALTVLIDGPEYGATGTEYLTTPNPVMGDTSYQVIVGRDASYGIDMSGSEGVVEIPYNENLVFDRNKSFKISLRVRPHQVSGRQRVYVNVPNVGFGLENDGLIFTTYGHQDNIFAGLGIVANEWNNIVLDYAPRANNLGYFDIYVNGVNVFSGQRTITNGGSSAPSYIGGVLTNSEDFEGELDYLAIAKNGKPALQFDFLSAQGSNEAFDMNLSANGGAAQTGILNGLNRYEIWMPGEDTYVKLCPDTLTLNVLVEPETKAHFVMNNLNDGYKSLRERIQYACPNDTIRFANVMFGDTIKFESQIFLTKDLFIEGLGMNNGITLDGQDFTRLFDSPVDRTITYKDLQMINGSFPGGAGAFPVPDDCTLWNVRFEGHNKTDNKQAIGINASSNILIKGAVEIND